MSTNDASNPPETSDSPADPAADAPAQTEVEPAAEPATEAAPENSPADPEVNEVIEDDAPDTIKAQKSEDPEAPAQKTDEAPQGDVSEDPYPEAAEAPEVADDTAPDEQVAQKNDQEPAQDPEPKLQQESAQEPVVTPLPQEKAPESAPESPKPYTKKDYAEHYRATVEVLLASPDHPLNRRRPLTFPLWPKHRRWAYEDKIDDEAMAFQRRVFAERSTSEQARFALTKVKARGWEVADRWTTFAEHEDPAIRELYREVFPRDAKKYERWKKFMTAEGRPF